MSSIRIMSHVAKKPLAVASPCRLPVNTLLARTTRNYTYTTANNIPRSRWMTANTSTSTAQASKYYAKHPAVSSQRRLLHSSSPKNNKQHPNRDTKNNNTLTTLSTLSHFFAAGTGTFASTLLALYLATIVETSAHGFLYEYFPHKYFQIAEDDLPTCLYDREMARRNTGLVEFSRIKGVSDGLMMGVDGWMEPTAEVDAELLAEAEFEREQEERQGNSNTNNIQLSSAWQRKMTEKRASIIEEEEQDFLSRVANTNSSGGGMKKGSSLLEAKEKIQEEAARKLQERLMSVAMTA